MAALSRDRSAKVVLPSFTLGTAAVLMLPFCLSFQSPQGARLSGDIAVAFEQLWHHVFGEPLVTHAASKCDMYYCRCAAECCHQRGKLWMYHKQSILTSC